MCSLPPSFPVFAAFQCNKNSCFWFRKPCQAVGKREGQRKHKKQRGILGRIRGKSIYVAQSTEEKFSILGRSQLLIYEFWTFRFIFNQDAILLKSAVLGPRMHHSAFCRSYKMYFNILNNFVASI